MDKNLYLWELNQKKRIMKKLISAILLFALATAAFASEQPDQKWTYRASAAYYPTVPFVALPWWAIGVGLSADKDAGETSKVDFPPYVSLDGIYSFNTRWSLGLSVGYCGLTAHVYNADGTEKGDPSSLVLIPVTAVGRYNYLYRPKVKLYGSLEGGVIFCPDADSDVLPDAQLNPIGVEFGRKVFGLVELGIGLNYTGVRAGLGWRF